MSSQQSKQQIKLNQLNSILSTNNNNNSNQQTLLNEVETTISKEVNLWKIRELAITDGGLLNGTYVYLLLVLCLCYCLEGVLVFVVYLYSFLFVYDSCVGFSRLGLGVLWFG